MQRLVGLPTSESQVQGKPWTSRFVILSCVVMPKHFKSEALPPVRFGNLHNKHLDLQIHCTAVVKLVASIQGFPVLWCTLVSNTYLTQQSLVLVCLSVCLPCLSCSHFISPAENVSHLGGIQGLWGPLLDRGREGRRVEHYCITYSGSYHNSSSSLRPLRLRVARLSPAGKLSKLIGSDNMLLLDFIIFFVGK